VLKLRTVVAVPVKDEAESIGGCVTAIASQAGVQADAIVLLVNNTTDATATVIRALQPSLAVPVHVIEHDFPAECASAGAARRMAMEHAADFLRPDGVLLTTDADGHVPPDWIATALQYIDDGLDLVAGRVALDPADAARIPPALHDNDALEGAYARALDEIVARIDPDPWDPWPRHSEHSGASLAVRLDAYRRVGGMPASPLAEDRRFVAALRRIDARIRHAQEIVVMVSGRTIGRAEGGMADTIRRRLSAPDPYLDDALEPVGQVVRRARLRAALRRVHAFATVHDRALVATLSGAPAATVEDACSAEFVGEGMALLTTAGPLLRRILVPAADVLRQTSAAHAALRELDHEDVAMSAHCSKTI